MLLIDCNKILGYIIYGLIYMSDCWEELMNMGDLL